VRSARRLATAEPAATAAMLVVVLAGCGGHGAGTAARLKTADGTAAELQTADGTAAGLKTADGTAVGLEAVRAGRSSSLRAERPLTAAEWESLRGLAGLRELVLEHGRADDAHALILATLPDLERLVLRESPLGDEGFRRLAGIRKLRDLNVPQAACTAEGIRTLAALPALRVLRLGGPNLARQEGGGPEVCRAVATLAGLRSLHLIDVPIGDAGLETLAGLPGLWNLYLDGAGVSDEAWAGYFRRCPDVHVHVDQAHHDRDPNAHDH